MLFCFAYVLYSLQSKGKEKLFIWTSEIVKYQNKQFAKWSKEVKLLKKKLKINLRLQSLGSFGPEAWIRFWLQEDNYTVKTLVTVLSFMDLIYNYMYLPTNVQYIK